MDLIAHAPWLQQFSFASLLQWVGGQSGGSETYILSRWIFLRALGIIYLIAFISLWVQIKGLVGANGILPAQEYLTAVKAQIPGAERFWMLPTVFWVSASDAALMIVCALGVLCSLLLIGGVAPVLCLIFLWFFYLSLSIAGQTFLSFQWDILLLEAGFVAIFFAPTGLLPGLARETAVSPLVLLLFWWLIFRLMFESGVVKLTSGDPAWRDLTALTYHYETTPIPTWTSWFMHNLPAWFHQASTVKMYAIELVFPFLIFLAWPLRLVGAAGMALLNFIILATGNYTFFNFLAIVLCIPLVHDAIWLKVLPTKFLEWVGYSAEATHALLPWNYSATILAIAFAIFLISGAQVWRTIMPYSALAKRTDYSLRFFDNLRTVNEYGLFRVMTKERPEIIVEGSNDGTNWQAYEFKWKPGDLQRRPAFVEPHQPRVDWQMWFAALGSFERNPWFQRMIVKLLQGESQVLALLEHNPFPEAPPKYIRAQYYDYQFTTPAERRETGNWWKRTLRGAYAPAMSLQ